MGSGLLKKQLRAKHAFEIVAEPCNVFKIINWADPVANASKSTMIHKLKNKSRNWTPVPRPLCNSYIFRTSTNSYSRLTTAQKNLL